jgi:hypothetical protein
MANSNRVFVSPGVYTSELDLTYVAQSVGVTTLGLVGETLKGPAFEPILITNFDDFKTYFGPTSALKDGNGNPKYELPYVSKSYLQESNQLFVTRVLGLTGYKPSTTFGITTLAGITYDSTSTITGGTISTLSQIGLDPTDLTNPLCTFYGNLSGKTATTGESVIDWIENWGLTVSEGDWFTIGLVPTDSVEYGTITGNEITGPIGDVTGPTWSNVFYHETNGIVDGLYSYLFIYSNGTLAIYQYDYNTATTNSYDGLVVAALRPRGYYTSASTLVLSATGLTISSSTLESDPMSDFTVTITTNTTGGTKTFTCSLDNTSTHFISKVLGTDVYDKNHIDYPLYVYESYSNLINALADRGLIRGLSTTVITHSVGDDFMTTWDTPASPMVVSEVRGGKVADLFQILTIPDGDSANYQIKITILNVNLETGEFDILVRDFNDTDDNQLVLEKYSRCTMNPELPGYVALKIGTSDTKYSLNSKYIMLLMNDDHPTDAVPAGFKGFTADSLEGTIIGNVMYKTEYYTAGDIVTYTNGVPDDMDTDKIKKVSLGLSDQMGYDSDLFKYKGKNATSISTGFHLSVNAATITGLTISGFEYDCTPYDFEGQTGDSVSNPLTVLANRKFTFAVCGGFDGWDIYRNVRTFDDRFIYGKTTYVNNWDTNGGVFNHHVGNSDYYSYVQGIATFANPEAVDINVFATPGINFYDHSSLTEQAIDMVETERADSLYIIASPNTDSTSDIVNMMDTSGLDSNYSAVYWPWIQIRDNDNSAQLFIPATGEVCRNIALTDNVSYPWFAVAGYSRGIVNAVKAVKKLTLDERDSLYKNRINPIATFSDTGPIIWGNKTLQVKESALDRINVRRLLLRARKLISAVAVRLLFEQNDDQVRNEFTRLVNPILEAIKKERGLYDFRLVVSNDPEDIDQNTLRGKIYIKPTRSLEFIDIEFIITPTGASFENV